MVIPEEHRAQNHMNSHYCALKPATLPFNMKICALTYADTVSHVDSVLLKIRSADF
jgi:hypothetical protein